MTSFKASKDRITVWGSVRLYKFKTFVIWYIENPRAFEHIDKHILLLYYRSSKRARMTQLFF